MEGRRPRVSGTVGHRRRHTMRTLTRVALFAVAALALAGCGGEDLPQNFLAPEGPIAEKQDGLWNLVFWVATAIFVIVEGALVFLLIRFRARPTDTELPKQTHGNTKLEILWTLIPAAILAVIAVPTVQLILELAAEPENPLEVRVIAKQYWWEFEYTGDEGKGVITANELAIPVGRPVLLTMESVGQQPNNPADPGVIHSFWVPKLAGKQDIIPGQTRQLTIEAEKPGVSYSGQCAEFCGLSHANMRFAVLSMTPEDFTAWIDDQSRPAPEAGGDAAAGSELFTQRQCIGCHAISGYDGAEARVGPNLTKFAQRKKFAGYMLDNDINEEAANVSAWLKSPQAVKPGSQMPDLGLSDDDVANLVAYLRTLK